VIVLDAADPPDRLADEIAERLGLEGQARGLSRRGRPRGPAR
jgi:hypothetical protein